MRSFFALVKKETAALFLTPLVYCAATFFVLLDSFAFYLTTVNYATAYAMFDSMANFMLFTSIILYPVLTMDMFAEENASGTLETLLTAPIGRFAVIMAKYTGAMIFVCIYLVHGLVYAALLSSGGDLDWNCTLAGLLALFAVGSMAVSLGLFISTLTISPVAAVGGTVGILVFMAFTADFDPYASTLSGILNNVSFIPHAKRWIAGELDTRGLMYFLSTTILFLFYTWLSLGTKFLEKRLADNTVRRRMTITYFLILAGIACLIFQAALLHIRGFWESGTPFGPGLKRVPTTLLVPMMVAGGLFFWSYLTFRAAKRAERGDRRKRQFKYQTISESRVMGASRYYYEENIREKRRIRWAAFAAMLVVLNLNWLAHYPFRTFTDSEHFGFLTHLQERSWDVSHDRRNSLSLTTRRVLDSL